MSCHLEARVRYEASPCENFGGQGGRWNRFSPASITPTLVFNPLCSYQKDNLAKTANPKNSNALSTTEEHWIGKYFFSELIISGCAVYFSARA